MQQSWTRSAKYDKSTACNSYYVTREQYFVWLILSSANCGFQLQKSHWWLASDHNSLPRANKFPPRWPWSKLHDPTYGLIWVLRSIIYVVWSLLWLLKVAQNWRSSKEPLDTILTARSCPYVSAGSNDHPMTNYTAMNSIFSFIKDKIGKVKPQLQLVSKGLDLPGDIKVALCHCIWFTLSHNRHPPPVQLLRYFCKLPYISPEAISSFYKEPAGWVQSIDLAR